MNQNPSTYKSCCLRQLLSLVTCCVALLCGSTAFGQLHGVSIAKGVAGPNGDFFLPRAHIGDVVQVQITVGNFDTAGHSITLTSLTDKVFFQSGNVTSPTLFAGNVGGVLLVSLGDTYTTNTTYIAGLGNPALPPFFSVDKLQDEAATRGVDNGTALLVTATAQATLDILIPSIRVTKTCQ
jgi:hypothetical protein